MPREDPATLDIRIRKKRRWEPQPSSHHESGAWKDDPSVKMLPLQREDLSSVPRTHISVLTTARNSNPGDLLTTLGATHTHTQIYIQTDRHTYVRTHTHFYIKKSRHESWEVSQLEKCLLYKHEFRSLTLAPMVPIARGQGPK